ncbi:pyridoxal 5'-phosphate synthase glutaminase subunit PdxT [Candidatus Aquiluna sp. UB-MaderosW2red]|uniref:pyridoxal 5'-phosphate synthase glutaminase subunit PdxT n=1 Tax=Candidatus Aquiluna sp. UB-MaderosW2red TaxID=1855377 RepID=UPI000875EC1B|nr:pyridoxal 5'-phosphate synthase glutaminase subunit PdxT [Candidatus Aquiluna sp. UB-MaderosW2red]SCX11409.1 5'-phosphate synthase pdxT subunit [Candidatus Aquiluna sp. UB-MaderosW2red]
MLIGVLGLQGDYREHEAMLESLSVKAKKVRTAAELLNIDGLIIPGGESTAMSNLAKSFGLIEPLRDFVKAKPTLGTCAGLIMLSEEVEGAIPGQEFLGGLPIRTSRNAYGGQSYSFEAQIEIAGQKADVAFIRAPKILDTKKTEVIATLNGEPVAVKYRNIFGASFHPEITKNPILHSLFIDAVKKHKER